MRPWPATRDAATRTRPRGAYNNLAASSWIERTGGSGGCVPAARCAYRPDFAKCLKSACTSHQAIFSEGRGGRLPARALRLDPDFSDAALARALALLLQGDFERGWREYEVALAVRALLPASLPPTGVGRLPSGGRTILLYAEQGFGDTLQFIRYAPPVQQRGGKVLAECQDLVLRLLTGCPGVERLVEAGAPLPNFDVHAPLLSLPRTSGHNGGHGAGPVPYLFADARLVERWRETIGVRTGFKIGMVWQGNPKRTPTTSGGPSR